MGDICVNHEWGRLKEVVVGYPYVKYPKIAPPLVHNFVSKAGISRYQKYAGKTLEAADPELYRQQVQQIDAVIKILQDHDVIVHQLKPFTAEEEQYLANLDDFTTQFFPRGAMIVIGDTFIEPALKLIGRRKERFPIRRTIGDCLKNSNARVIPMPMAPPIPYGQEGWDETPFLEGGDVFVLGHDIYVGCSGNASNDAGIDWLQATLGSNYQVHKIPITKHFLHLDFVLSILRPGLAVVCREGFVNGLPAFLKDWRLIDQSFEDAQSKLSCNHLVLDEETVIVASELPDLAQALRKAGQKVITTPMSAIYWQGGSLRCWHHPLVRESNLE